jgi:hypothetical protein
VRDRGVVRGGRPRQVGHPLSVASHFAPAWRRMYAASSALSMKLIGTSTAPRRASAKRSAAKPCELRARIATRSPLPTPRSASPAPTRSHRASNSP